MPVVVSTNPTASWDTTTTPKDTSSFNVVAGDLLVLWFSSAFSSSAGSTPIKQAGTATIGTVTVAKDGATTGNVCRVTAWVAIVTGDGTLTIRFASSAGDGWGGMVRVWRSNAGVGTANSGSNATSSASSVTLTGVALHSAIDMLQTDFAVGAITSRAYRTTDAGSFTETFAQALTDYTQYHGYYLDAGATASKAVGMTAPNQAWATVAVEVRDGIAIPPLTMAPMRA